MAPKPDQRPDAFLSYTRFDDRRGRISDFRTWLSDAVEEVSGQPFEIFQDVDDESGIALGKKWQHELDRMLDEARFFIPILTPKFFASPACRDELAKFLALEATSGRDDLVLPIYWIRCPELEEPSLTAGDALAMSIAARQRWDWHHLRHEDCETAAVQRELEELALQIDRVRRGLFRVVAQNQKIAAGGGSRAHMQVVESAPAPIITSNLHLLPSGAVFRDADDLWCPEMVAIPPGSFMMGSPEDEVEREVNEGPQHRVDIDKPFALGRYPVTRSEFAIFAMETDHRGEGAFLLKDDIWKFDSNADWYSPGFSQTGRHPAVCVNHEDALAYLVWLSEKTGMSYDLPSESMWEFACRAGTATPFWTGGTISTGQANFDGNVPYGSAKKGTWRLSTTEVDSFAANPFGLHDMHGNVWEWCADRWHRSYRGAPVDDAVWFAGNSAKRVLRGGSWINGAHLLRSASRYPMVSGYRYYNIGFRCARFQ